MYRMVADKIAGTGIGALTELFCIYATVLYVADS
jgi:hypothetical protein